MRQFVSSKAYLGQKASKARHQEIEEESVEQQQLSSLSSSIRMMIKNSNFKESPARKEEKSISALDILASASEHIAMDP